MCLANRLAVNARRPDIFPSSIRYMQRWFDKNETETAYVMVNCETGTEPKVIEELGTIDGVKEIKYTFGSYDIVTKVVAGSVEALREIITLRIRKIDRVRSTTTLICKEAIFPMVA